MGKKITLAQAYAQDGRYGYLLIYCEGRRAGGFGCHHFGEMSLLHAMALWGEDVRLDDLPLRCSRCGSRKLDVRTDHPRGIGGTPLT